MASLGILTVLAAAAAAGCGDNASEDSAGSDATAASEASTGPQSGTDFATVTGDALCGLIEPAVDEAMLGQPVATVEPVNTDPSNPSIPAACEIHTDYVTTSTSSSGGSSSTTASVVLSSIPAGEYSASTAAREWAANCSGSTDEQTVGQWSMYAARCDDSEIAQVIVDVDVGAMIAQLMYTQPVVLGSAPTEIAYELLERALA